MCFGLFFGEEENTLIGSQYSKLFYSSVYCSFIESEGVRNAYIVSVWNRSLNCHHLQCRHEALPSDFLLQIESFSHLRVCGSCNSCTFINMNCLYHVHDVCLRLRANKNI